MPESGRRTPELALGTVQFGLAYGISNPHGQFPAEQVAPTLRRAAEAGIRLLDTASAYGGSEAALGQALPTGDDRWRIVTKLPPGSTRASAGAAFAQSLARLARTKVYGLMAHRPEDLLADPSLIDWLLEQRRQGLASRVGVSVYTGEELASLSDRLGGKGLDLVQLPLNTYDQRLDRSGWLRRLGETGVEIHVRSLFLQGLLLLPPQRWTGHFAPWRGHHAAWWRWREQAGLSPVQAALGYGLQLPVQALVLGLHDPAQLDEWRAAMPVYADPAAWALDDEALLNPGRWGSA